MQFSFYIWLLEMGACRNVIAPGIDVDAQEQARWLQFFKDRDFKKL